jgi:uncharacterized membrane protein
LATLIGRQIDDWENRGVIDTETASRLRGDIGASLAGVNTPAETKAARRFSFFQVVAFFAAISFAAAVLIFIAANWEFIPRLWRVIGVVLIMIAGFTGGAYARGRGWRRAPLIEEACYLVGGAAFVGVIALVGQMYHISGDERDAALVYAVGLGLSGFAVRSFVLTAAAAAWITWWQVTGPEAGNLLSLQFLVFALAIGAGLLFSLWIRSPWLRRGLYGAAVIGLLPFCGEVLEFVVDVYEAIPDQLRIAFWVAAWVLSLAGLAAERWSPEAIRRLPLFSRPRVGGLFALGLVAIVFLHGELGDENAGLVVAAVMGILFSVVALYIHGRDWRAVRYISYVLFVGEILLVYGETVFSMLGTSGFFLVLALVLTLVAIVFYRLERRMRKPRVKEAGDA